MSDCHILHVCALCEIWKLAFHPLAFMIRLFLCCSFFEFALISVNNFQENKTALDNAKEEGNKEIAALLGKQNIYCIINWILLFILIYLLSRIIYFNFILFCCFSFYFNSILFYVIVIFMSSSVNLTFNIQNFFLLSCPKMAFLYHPQEQECLFSLLVAILELWWLKTALIHSFEKIQNVNHLLSVFSQ